MMHRTTLLVTFFLTFLALPGAAEARPGSLPHRQFPVTITDDLHNRVHLSHQPRRIVSLDPRDTETLFALGLENRVVGDGGQFAEGAAGVARPFRFPSEWPSPLGRDYPVRSKQLPHVEGGFGSSPFDLEKIESLQPDLVVGLNSDLPTIQKLRDLGLAVIILDPANVAGILHDIGLLGRATGAGKQAALVRSRIDQQLATIGKQVQHAKQRPRVYYEIDATNPSQPFTAGPGTYIDEAIRLGGGMNVANGVTTCHGTRCYPQFSLEALVKLDPGLIVLGDAAYGTTTASVRDRPGWSTIKAVKSNNIHPFNDELISRAGPRIGIGLLKLARMIHPEVFSHRAGSRR